MGLIADLTGPFDNYRETICEYRYPFISIGKQVIYTGFPDYPMV